MEYTLTSRGLVPVDEVKEDDEIIIGPYLIQGTKKWKICKISPKMTNQQRRQF